jgi:hypothetical protein
MLYGPRGGQHLIRQPPHWRPLIDTLALRPLRPGRTLTPEASDVFGQQASLAATSTHVGRQLDKAYLAASVLSSSYARASKARNVAAVFVSRAPLDAGALAILPSPRWV